MHPGTNTYSYVFHIEIYIISVIKELFETNKACMLSVHSTKNNKSAYSSIHLQTNMGTQLRYQLHQMMGCSHTSTKHTPCVHTTSQLQVEQPRKLIKYPNNTKFLALAMLPSRCFFCLDSRC
jgi:hypothetical protein